MNDDDLTARSTSRATVTYDTYVLAYAARQRGHVLLAVVGLVVTIGGGVYLSGAWLIMTAAVGIGLSAAGVAGFLVTADAHATYTRHLAVSVSETYSRPATPAPQPETVRPFVASTNGGNTVRVGRFDFDPPVWQSLLNRALANGGVITRDIAKDAGVGRSWYHGEGWTRLQEELQRLGFIDARNRVTPAALAWYEQRIPLPLDAFPVRSRNARTNGERTTANGTVMAGVGEAD